MSTVLIADTVVAGDVELSPGWVSIAGDRIDAVGAGTRDDGTRLSGILVPGFVDVHSHGAAGADFGAAVDGTIAPALDHQVRHGTTTVIASLATAPIDVLEEQVRALAPLVTRGPLRGVHLEGPWLSVGHRGTHAASLLRAPDAREVERLIGATGAVRMVTVAPELPGGVDAIRAIVAAGIVAAVGHTSSTTEEARRGFDAGATVATHLFNGMPQLHHREPGPVGIALADDRVFLELILDGHHLAPATVELVARAAGDRVMAVSDSIAATGFDDGSYELAGTPIVVRDGVARAEDSGSLAGSTRLLQTAFATLVRDHGFTFARAAAATSGTAARALSLTDVGRIGPGMRADLVLLDDLAVSAVMLGGEWVDRS